MCVGARGLSGEKGWGEKAGGGQGKRQPGLLLSSLPTGNVDLGTLLTSSSVCSVCSVMVGWHHRLDGHEFE